MRILVLQLARLGDILQTLPTVQALKAKYGSESEITFVCRQTFADAARISPAIDRLVEFPTKLVLAPALAEKANGRAESLSLLKNWLATQILWDSKTGQKAAAYDLVLNLTFSETSSFLTEIIPAKEKRGLRRAADGGLLINDSWSKYFYSQVLRKNLNMLHVTDLFLRIANTDKSGWPVQIDQKLLETKAKTSAEEKRIGIQISASQGKKTLTPEAWAVICREVLAQVPNSSLLFFGAASDSASIEKIRADSFIQSKSQNIAGTVAFHQNVAWVKSCEAIVCPDTAIVHLASICGVRTVYLPLGDVVATETGPYGEGHQILYSGLANIQQLATQVTNALLLKNVEAPIAWAKTRLASCTTGIARNDVKPQNFVDDEIRNFFEKAYYLLAEFRCSGREEDIEIPNLGDPAQVGSLDKLTQTFESLSTIRRIAEFGQHYCVQLLTHQNDKRKLQLVTQKLAEIDEMLLEVQKSVFFLKPLIDTWSVAKENAISTDLEELIGKIEATYRELAQNVDIVHQLMQTAVQAALARIQSKSEKTIPESSNRNPLKELEP